MDNVIERHLGIPYAHAGRDKNGADCYGLGIILYKNVFGIDLEDFHTPNKGPTYSRFVDEKYKSIRSSSWIKVKEPAFLDVIAIDSVHIKDREIVTHIGFWVDIRQMLHINEVTKYSCLERFSSYGHKIIGFYRHVKNT